MSTPLIDPATFVESDDTPRKLSGRTAERSAYFDLIVKMAESDKGQMTPKTVSKEEYDSVTSDIRTGLRQVNAARDADGKGPLYVQFRRVIFDPKNGKRVKQGTQFLWFRITDQPGRKLGPRVNRSNGDTEIPVDGENEGQPDF